jgi:hypothetical protein
MLLPVNFVGDGTKSCTCISMSILALTVRRIFRSALPIRRSRLLQLAQRSEEVFERNPFSEQLPWGSQSIPVDALLEGSTAYLHDGPDSERHQPPTADLDPNGFDFQWESPGSTIDKDLVQVPPVRSI